MAFDSTGSAEMTRGLRAIPRGVWALGFVTLFMDTSSEMIHSLLPVFLVTIMGASGPPSACSKVSPKRPCS